MPRLSWNARFGASGLGIEENDRRILKVGGYPQAKWVADSEPVASPIGPRATPRQSARTPPVLKEQGRRRSRDLKWSNTLAALETRSLQPLDDNTRAMFQSTRSQSPTNHKKSLRLACVARIRAATAPAG
jgi:hypothetical protein